MERENILEREREETWAFGSRIQKTHTFFIRQRCFFLFSFLIHPVVMSTRVKRARAQNEEFTKERESGPKKKVEVEVEKEKKREDFFFRFFIFRLPREGARRDSSLLSFSLFCTRSFPLLLLLPTRRLGGAPLPRCRRRLGSERQKSKRQKGGSF